MQTNNSIDHSRPGNNIYLIGMMGSWKSTVGKLLAKDMDISFFDLDEEIIRKSEYDSVPEIFRHGGEKGFRTLETDTLQQLGNYQGAVIATGGGTVVEESNRVRMRNTGWVVLLRARPKTLKNRIRNVSKRPLLARAEDVENELRTLWNIRRHLYEQTAHAIVDTDSEEPTEVVNDILNLYHRLHKDNL